MTKSKGNITELLLFANKINFEEIGLFFNTIEADKSIGSPLFTQKDLIRRLSMHETEEILVGFNDALMTQ